MSLRECDHCGEDVETTTLRSWKGAELCPACYEMHTNYLGRGFRIQEARPSSVPPALDTERAFVWGLGFMVFLALIAIVWMVGTGALGPGFDFAILFLGAFVGVAAILLYEIRKHS